jgi:tRNA(fMet)-specific endonuclease VapC
MSPLYILDTNIVSYLMKEQAPALLTRFELASADEVAVSSITQAEVFYGLAKKPSVMRLRLAAEKFFASVACLGWDSAAARAYGLLRAEQERKGRPLSTEDLMIAAHALSLGLTLVTNDSVFSFIDGLKTEDWTVA